LAATPVFADIESPCADLWFSRNAMLDQAGYCFATQLGKAIFDNSGCTTKEPVLSRVIEMQIAETIKLEQGGDGGFYDVCMIDTSKRKLDMDAIPLRKQLDFQPATDGGPAFALTAMTPKSRYSAPWKRARQVGFIRAGDNMTSSHLDWKGWSFTLIGQHADWSAVGRYRAELDENNCDTFAG